MWILRKSTNLLSSLVHLGVRKATSIQIFDFPTLYTSIPHGLLESRMNNIINNAFEHENGATRYTHIRVGRNKSYVINYPLRWTQRENAGCRPPEAHTYIVCLGKYRGRYKFNNKNWLISCSGQYLITRSHFLNQTNCEIIFSIFSFICLSYFEIVLF